MALQLEALAPPPQPITANELRSPRPQIRRALGLPASPTCRSRFATKTLGQGSVANLDLTLQPLGSYEARRR